jgi:hypothetical protein
MTVRAYYINGSYCMIISYINIPIACCFDHQICIILEVIKIHCYWFGILE